MPHQLEILSAPADMPTSLERIRQDEARVSDRRNGYRYMFVEQHTLSSIYPAALEELVDLGCFTLILLIISFFIRCKHCIHD